MDEPSVASERSGQFAQPIDTVLVAGQQHGRPEVISKRLRSFSQPTAFQSHVYQAREETLQDRGSGVS